ncbi:MAG: OmpA family protein [Deltaproteobacteria bacterium]|nr:OmpA family protein [Deltaproteobacteria bacterium]MBW2661671.1 OmpA family protein [Deltaproteobacteria bacterium]
MKKITIMFVIAILMISTNLFAQKTADIEGSKDYPMVSRFQGSVIQWYQQINFDRYFILSLHDHKISNYEVDGKITRIQYSAGKEHSVFEIYKSYENSLKKTGFEILTTLDDRNCGVNLQERLYNDEFHGLNKLPRAAANPGDDKFAYLAAKKKINNKDIYIVVYTADERGDLLITFDAIEVQGMEDDLVTVKSLDENITANGHIAIYDILFDTGKSKIKSGSSVALRAVAEYLKAHASKKFLIVGHSDNVGNFDTNIKLSKERAKAVMSELITKYNVKPEQLNAYGDGSTAPVASNSTDAGRTKNRRVEVVEQ